jgi:hypothetical protein
MVWKRAPQLGAGPLGREDARQLNDYLRDVSSLLGGIRGAAPIQVSQDSVGIIIRLSSDLDLTHQTLATPWTWQIQPDQSWLTTAEPPNEATLSTGGLPEGWGYQAITAPYELCGPLFWCYDSYRLGSGTTTANLRPVLPGQNPDGVPQGAQLETFPENTVQAVGGAVNDWEPVVAVVMHRLDTEDTTTGVELTGIVPFGLHGGGAVLNTDPNSAPVAPAPQFQALTNVGAGSITLRDDNERSSGFNRFYIGGRGILPLAQDDSVLLWYDPVVGRHRVLASSAPVLRNSQDVTFDSGLNLVQLSPGVDWLRISGAGSLTGMKGGLHNRRVLLTCVSGGDITLSDRDAVAAHDGFRLSCVREDETGSFGIGLNASVWVVYDATSGYWRDAAGITIGRSNSEQIVTDVVCDGSDLVVTRKTFIFQNGLLKSVVD